MKTKISLRESKQPRTEYDQFSQKVHRRQAWTKFNPSFFLCASSFRFFLTLQNPPYLMEKKRDDGKHLTGNDRYEGYCVDLANKILGERLHYNYELRLVKDNKFGVKTSEGTWNGMVGELTRRVRSCIMCIWLLLYIF
jgi:hypothetical protein